MKNTAATTDSYIAFVAHEIRVNGDQPKKANVQRYATRADVANLSDALFNRFANRVAREYKAQVQEAADLAAF
jgi:hypothetical protein